MPLQRREPRASSVRRNLRHLEIARKRIEANGCFKYGEVLLALHIVVDLLGDEVIDRELSYTFLMCALSAIWLGLGHQADIQQHRLRSHAQDNPKCKP